MKFVRTRYEKLVLSIAGVFIVSQVFLGLNDSNTGMFFCYKKKNVCSINDPKNYFVTKIACFLDDWNEIGGNEVIEKINDVFKVLDIQAHIIKNTLKCKDGAFEFLVYIDKYKKSFPARYTPLSKDLNEIIKEEKFSLEIKIFSAWRPLQLEKMFG